MNEWARDKHNIDDSRVKTGQATPAYPLGVPIKHLNCVSIKALYGAVDEHHYFVPIEHFIVLL